jgi:hypothetical protein
MLEKFLSSKRIELSFDQNKAAQGEKPRCITSKLLNNKG